MMDKHLVREAVDMALYKFVEDQFKLMMHVGKPEAGKAKADFVDSVKTALLTHFEVCGALNVLDEDENPKEPEKPVDPVSEAPKPHPEPDEYPEQHPIDSVEDPKHPSLETTKEKEPV